MRVRQLVSIFILWVVGLPAWAGAIRGGAVAGTVWSDDRQQPVADAVVYLGGVRTPTPVDVSPVVLDQQHNQFVPHIQLARAGAPLIIQNSDPYLHVFRIELLQGGQKPQLWFRQATPYAGFEKRGTLPAAPEPFLLRFRGENGETRMIAYIAVIPHPWAALTDAQGRYQINDIPPGDYRLFAWHETSGTLAGQVNVVRGRTSQVRLAFPHAP